MNSIYQLAALVYLFMISDWQSRWNHCNSGLLIDDPCFMKTQMVRVFWYDSFQRSLSWASSCNNTTASRLLLSCHTAAMATACQSQACVQNDTLKMTKSCALFLSQFTIMLELHCKIKHPLLLWFVSHINHFCRTWKSAWLSEKSLWGLWCLLSAGDKRDALTIVVMLLLLVVYLVASYSLCLQVARLLDVCCFVSCKWIIRVRH